MVGSTWQVTHSHTPLDQWPPRHKLDELLDTGGGRHLGEVPHGASERVEFELDGGGGGLHLHPGP